MKTIAKDPALELAMKPPHGILHKDVQTRIQTYLPSDENASIPSSLIIDYLAGSLMALIKWWRKHDMTYTPEQMDEIFQQLAMLGVSATHKKEN